MIKILNKLGIYNKSDFLQLFLQFIKFGIVGVSNTLISYVIYIVCVYIGIHYIWANTIAFIVSVLNAYYWNSKYVFKQGEADARARIKSAAKLFVSYTATFLLGTILLVLWVEGLGISENIAPLINYCITIPLNFVLNKFWSFNEKTF